MRAFEKLYYISRPETDITAIYGVEVLIHEWKWFGSVLIFRQSIDTLYKVSRWSTQHSGSYWEILEEFYVGHVTIVNVYMEATICFC